ncbi:hypothetical protein [Maribacter sp. 2307ULW6-5]|uniref:hypothetical protein n=1 Tax=Maribacter sp. 2307ULW6-5 TaxID=3386275 RepID=UPI0039BCD8A5
MKRIALFIMAGALMVSCNLKKEDKGELPEVDVDVTADSGELPVYEVNWADVEVGTRTEMVEIPKVVVVMEEEEVEIPYVDVDMPNGDQKKERTLMVEAEVTDMEHELEIQEIWAAGNHLHVIAQLEATDQSIGDQTMRVSDQITLNAPDLDVRYYIVGSRPDRVFNTRYDYLNSTDELRGSLESPTVIYKR